MLPTFAAQHMKEETEFLHVTTSNIEENGSSAANPAG